MEAEYRYEKKFLVEACTLADIMQAVRRHPAMFSEIYPPRFVNNIYLDSPFLGDYFSNVNGYARRGKVRVRWYHQLFRAVNDAVLEYKIKEGEVGRKKQFPFPDFTLQEGFCEQDFHERIKRSQLPESVRRNLRDLEFSVLNRYKRWYFSTPDRRFRLTVDHNPTYYRLSKLHNQFLSRWIDRTHLIVELKYAVQDDVDAHRITTRLPFRITRSSKYVTGVDWVYL